MRLNNAMIDDVVQRTGRPLQDRSMLTARHIIKEGLKMFTDSSLFEVDPTVLAKRAGVNRAAIYNRFGGMHGVLAACAEVLRVAESRGQDVSAYQFVRDLHNHETKVKRGA